MLHAIVRNYVSVYLPASCVISEVKQYQTVQFVYFTRYCKELCQRIPSSQLCYIRD